MLDEAELAPLFRSALDGDEAAYGAFLRAVAPRIRCLARRRLAPGTGIDPEDVVQETLLAIHLKRHTWRRDEPVGPWISAITRYKAIDAMRRRGVAALDIQAFDDVLAAPEVETVIERDVETALSGLPDRQRSVVTAITVQGHSIRDTATRLGMKEGAVRVALHRGLSAIRMRFGQQTT